MIYEFPDLDTLRLVITSSVVPPEVSLAPAVAGIDDEGHVWLQPSVALPKKAQNALRKMGVQTLEANGDLKAEEVSCWLQMLPVERDATPPAFSAQAPVLFELQGADALPDLVGEMLRLGNDRQSFRWLQDGKRERVLLRVIGPPYYSLLRALDANGHASAPRAYVERAPGVWVEAGHTHSLVEYLKPTAGKFLLLRPPREWVFLDEGPFRDIYEILDFALPEAKVAWSEAEAGPRLKVPLRLAAGGATEAPELWVLREQAFEQIDTLVKTADDHLLSRLAFAVGEHEGQKSIVLRVRPSKQAPPVLVLPDAVSFRPYLKLANLFMPSGLRLQPPLRRDAVRQLLANDPDSIVWLYPREDDTFVPQSLPDAAFRPLQDWVEYVLDRDQEALQAWIAATRFDFDAYICKDDEKGTPKPPKGKAPTQRERKSMLAEELDSAEESPEPVPEKPKSRRAKEEDDFAALPEAKPSELQKRLSELQGQFLAAEGPLDDPNRQALWSQMAVLHGALEQTDDAAICWLNHLWDHDAPSPDAARQWLRTETKQPQRQVNGAELDRLLTLTDPLPTDMRALVAAIVHAVADAPPSAANKKSNSRPLTPAQQAIVERLPRIHAFLEEHESRLGIRAVWLAWSSLARLSAGDVLALARTRDRLLERLLNHGLNPQYDMPSFLRFSGQETSERYRTVRDRVVVLRDLAQEWIKRCYSRGINQAQDHEHHVAEATQAYKDLMFAFGLARLGEVGVCHRLKHQASEVLGQRDEVHSFLLQAFTYRVEQALAGNAHSGPLPPEQLEYLQDMVERGKQSSEEKVKPYKVDRLRESSRILEPHERIDAYRTWRANTDDLARELATLFAVPDRQQLEEGIAKLLKAQRRPREVLRVMMTAFELAPRLSEKVTVEVLGQLVKMREAVVVVQDLHELESRAKLLERALFLAAHYDRAEYLQQLVNSFVQLLETQRGDNAAQALDALAGQCLRGLRKLGLREEIDGLLQRMTDLVMQGQELANLRQRLKDQWANTLRTLLQIASGWLYFGRTEQAMPVLEEARRLLFEEDSKLAPVFRTKLACRYAETLGQLPVELALKRFEELFRKLNYLCDTFTTNSHYSLSQLQVVEAVVLAVVSDDFAVGQNVRRWLDEDEYLVRRRIHHDLRTLMNQSGL
jgi:hypothetical protein